MDNVNLTDVHTITDAARYIAGLLQECELGRRSREDTAATIVGLMALDESDLWAAEDTDYMLIVDNLAPDAELSAADADAVWPELTTTAARLSKRWR